MSRDTYRDECRQRQIQIQRDREQIYKSAAEKLAGQICEAINGVSRESLRDVVELFAWREWASRVLYGPDACQHPNYWDGVDGDRRSWIEGRLKGKDRELLRRIAELEAENLDLRRRLECQTHV